MARNYTDEEGQRLHQLTHAILNAVIGQGASSGDPGGFVDPYLATEALCDAIAALRSMGSVDETPAERRAMAEECRKRVLAASDVFAEMRARGEGNPYLGLSTPPASH